MDFYKQSAESVLKTFNSDKLVGLSKDNVEKNKIKYGKNLLTKGRRKNLFEKIFMALKEPMLLILLISFIIALGISLGRYFKTGSSDFADCIGILSAIVLSVSITLIMEGSSERAFNVLNKIYDNVKVKTIRGGKVSLINQHELVVGDVVLIESGDKIAGDGRLIEGNGIKIDESCLTGESIAVNKNPSVINDNCALAERYNCVYSGTFVTEGSGKYVITAVGDKTEMGNIAGEIRQDKAYDSPLQQKLAKLSKTVTWLGVSCAILVFILSIIKLIVTKNLTFNGVQELFVSSIILIVAAVPEGLPTIVAVSLALNMIKLAKENALIKKMIATETAGAVSVICSDKTGTLTKNQMSVISVCKNEVCLTAKELTDNVILQNFVCNSTATIERKSKKIEYHGSGTECALIKAFIKSQPKLDIEDYRNKYNVIDRTPFSSEKKYMTTTILMDGIKRELIKGAPEKVIKLCNLTESQQQKINLSIEKEQEKAGRVLCFAHKDEGKEYVYDGYCVLADEIREEVYSAIKDCKKAGIKVKILTGDNSVTAFAVAKKLKIASAKTEIISAQEIELMTDEYLKKVLPKISVISRSTPKIKARVVRILKESGEVVAVTGDGVNDAPAIKRADVGIAMGKTGSEITKETAEVILLDDSFATIVKAISFGRNVFRNLQRFIMFQLSVNLTALLFVTLTAILGLETPFNTLQLLWINIIMDGPPALTLGLERAGDDLMNNPPVKRDKSIVSKKMLIRIIFNGLFMGVILILQYLTNFLGALDGERKSAIFTLFIMFQLFNAFNCRQLGSESILKGIKKNKIMLITFLCVFLVQIIIIQFLPFLFGVGSMRISLWLKIILLSFSIIAVSEIYKFIYRKKLKVDK